jgi:hypothetical protein
MEALRLTHFTLWMGKWQPCLSGSLCSQISIQDLGRTRVREKRLLGLFGSVWESLQELQAHENPEQGAIKTVKDIETLMKRYLDFEYYPV